MVDFLWNTGSFIIGLGILITVHEFGHFWIARRCGVKVLRFSIGFGPVLLQKTGRDGTEYAVSLIPLGGYVKMLDERVDSVPKHEKPYAFNNQSLPKRFSIVAAGPVFNFIFAVFAYWVIFIVGVPTIKPVVGSVVPDSVASQSQINAGMIITDVGNLPTSNWNEVNMALASHIGDRQVVIKLRSDNGQYFIERTLDLNAWKIDPEKQLPMTSLGIEAYHPSIQSQISRVAENSPAATAGLKVGDKLQKINGNPIIKWTDFIEFIQTHTNEVLNLEIERNGAIMLLKIKPEAKQINGTIRGFLGIAPTMLPWPENYVENIQFNPLIAVVKAGEKTWELIGMTANLTRKIFTGDIGIKNLSGPISIAKGAGVTASYGVVSFLSFLALISVNLGLVNLFPLPVLDGGHLLFFIIEGIIRRPIPEKVQEYSFRFGAALLFMLMGVALFNDFTRL